MGELFTFILGKISYFSSLDNQVMIKSRQTATSAGGDDDNILNPNPKLILQVNPWFNRKDHAWLQHCLAGGRNPRRFVTFQPQPVAGAMGKESAVAGLFDGLPRRLVYLASRNSGYGGFSSAPVGLLYRLISLLNFSGGLA
jgi:hypothetical protein